MRGKSLETVKSLILAALVVMSVFLTGYLWFGFSGRYASAEPTSGVVVTVRSGLNPGDFLLPSRIVLHEGNASFSLHTRGSNGYQNIWDDGKALSLLSTGPMGTATGQETDEVRKQGMGFEMFLPAEVSFAEWAGHWGIDSPPEWDFPTSRILLTTDGKRAFVRSEPGQYRVIPLVDDVRELTDVVARVTEGHREGAWLLPRQVAGADVRDGVYVPMLAPEVPNLSVKSESADVQGVLSSFFVDASVVRRIEEHDGATIHTDGRIGLRIYPGGALEYSVPVADQGLGLPDPVHSLRQAADFVAQYGSWPEDPFLLSWDTVLLTGMNEGLVFRFSYAIGGWPVFQDTPPLEVTLGNRGVVSYRRNLLVPTGEGGTERRTIRPADAIRAVWRDRSGALDGPVDDIYLAYHVRTGGYMEGMAFPVWVVKVEGYIPVLVDAHTGRVLQPGER